VLVVRAVLATFAFLGSATGFARAGETFGPGAIVSSIRDVSGKPVVGALVVADGPTTREAFTGSAGIVTLSGLPLGQYAVRVTRSGFEPIGTSVTLGATTDSIQVVKLNVLPATFAALTGASTATTPSRSDGGNAPYVAQALTQALAPNVVPDYLRAAATLEGTQPGETRAELDGIPIAGGPASVAALQFRNALQLDHIEFVQGPAPSSTSSQGAIGGIIDYRTTPISTALDGRMELGYDTVFGSFEHVSVSKTFGKFAFMADDVTGNGQTRAQIVKAQFALSQDTSLSAAVYGSQSAVSQGAGTLSNSAPAAAFDLRATLGSGSLRARLFRSESETTTSDAAVAQVEDWRIHGLQLDYDVPFGEDSGTISFDRRTENALFTGIAPIDETFTTLRVQADLQLSRESRLQLGDAIAGGTYLPRRYLPYVALAFHPEQMLTLRLAAGDAYATPLDVLGGEAGRAALDAAPETSFGIRASADMSLPGADHLQVAAYILRRFDSFESLSEARSTGIEAGFDRPALPHRLGIVADVNFMRTYAFGSQQPLERYVGLPLSAGEQLADDPYATARLAFAYRTAAGDVSFGSTLLGANNALSPHAIVLGDASLRLALASFADVRLGIENLFGQTIADPILAPLYPPHELTVTVGSP